MVNPSHTSPSGIKALPYTRLRIQEQITLQEEPSPRRCICSRDHQIFYLGIIAGIGCIASYMASFYSGQQYRNCIRVNEGGLCQNQFDEMMEQRLITWVVFTSSASFLTGACYDKIASTASAGLERMKNCFSCRRE